MHNLIVQLRSKLLVFLTHNMALPLLKIIRSPQKFPYTKPMLHLLPEGTLGKALVTMLDKRNLKLLPYYAKHDIKHILLQYDTTDEGEVCLQCFMLGNRHLSFPISATVAYGFITMPEHWSKFKKAYQHGASCKPVAGLPWFTLLDKPVQLLIQKINENEIALPHH